jgi:hypothetical protein
LFSQVASDVKAKLRSGASDAEFLNSSQYLARRTDRYSMDRLEALNSSNYDPKSHKKIEMISLGG